MTATAIPAVYGAISACTADLLGGVSKDRRNSGQGFNFRGIDQFMNAVAPVIARNGLVVLPRVISKRQDERQTAKGGTIFYTHLSVEFDFVAVADGSKAVVRTEGEAMDSADKSTNKAMSAALKYALMQAFMIPTEDMQDADAHDPEASERVTRAAQGVAKSMADASNPWVGRKEALKAKIAAANSTDAIDDLRGSDEWTGFVKGEGVPQGWPEALVEMARQRWREVA
ncbi:MAG: single-stranded DNA-binding protein [Erythrobacter sp.]|nr:single-stranded DNA-binding protein [Erythrobacter sp.]